jgi:signal transduction histidine kinase
VEEVLPQVANAAGSVLGVDYAQATIWLPNADRRSAEWGVPRGRFRETVPVVHESETLGELQLASAQPFLNEPTRQVLADFSNQAGLLFQNVRLTLELQARLDRISQLTAELRASRQRIVTAADTQRRRLEAAIHQQTERQLEEMANRLESVEGLLAENAPQAKAYLDELAEEANEALEGLRELARGVFPPLLVDQGVAAALQAHVRKQSIPVTLEVEDSLEERRLPPQVEAAVYFCCVQALQEATRLGASCCALRLSVLPDAVTFVVSVDVAAQALAESALEGMNDRVEALGGSLRVHPHPDDSCEVTGSIPLAVEEEEARQAEAAAASAQVAASRSGPNSDLGR